MGALLLTAPVLRLLGLLVGGDAVGRDHAPYMEAEVGATGLDVLRAVKAELDPAGIMNPGKLLEAG